MDKTEITKALEVMNKRFGHDTLISLATLDGRIPAVRIVNSYYESGAFYTVTYALSNKKQILRLQYVASGLLLMVLAKIWDMFVMNEIRKLQRV